VIKVRVEPADLPVLPARRERQAVAFVVTCPEQIAELVREFGASGVTQRQFCEDRWIALSELQRSLKIVRRNKNTLRLLAVEVEADKGPAQAMTGVTVLCPAAREQAIN
jgi:hypothetical protein